MSSDLPGQASAAAPFFPLNSPHPVYSQKMQLFSNTNTLLTIYVDKICGTFDQDNEHTYLEVLTAGSAGHVRIQGLLTKLFIAMNENGRLYCEENADEEQTIFIETFQGSYNTYLSKKYADREWYIGVKRSGKILKGPKTGYGQKTIQFLPLRTKFQ